MNSTRCLASLALVAVAVAVGAQADGTDRTTPVATGQVPRDGGAETTTIGSDPEGISYQGTDVVMVLSDGTVIAELGSDWPGETEQSASAEYYELPLKTDGLCLVNADGRWRLEPNGILHGDPQPSGAVVSVIQLGTSVEDDSSPCRSQCVLYLSGELVFELNRESGYCYVLAWASGGGDVLEVELVRQLEYGLPSSPHSLGSVHCSAECVFGTCEIDCDGQQLCARCFCLFGTPVCRCTSCNGSGGWGWGIAAGAQDASSLLQSESSHESQSAPGG